jgi:hypothetical protein
LHHHDDISAIRRKKPQFAAKHPDSLQFAAWRRKMPQNAKIRCKTLQNAAKRRKMPQDPQDAAKRNKTPQFAAKCKSTFKQISQIESGNFSNSEKFP